MQTKNQSTQEQDLDTSPNKDFDEDRAALLASKAYAVVTRDEQYPLINVEEELI